MTIQVVLKETRQIEPFASAARKMFEANQKRLGDIKIVGTITNGNTQEVLIRDKTHNEIVYHFGSRFELDSLRRRNKMDANRIRDFAEFDSKNLTVVDIDSMDLIPSRFETSVIQHWSNQNGGRRIYFEDKESEIARVDKSTILAPYLVLSKLTGLFEQVYVNIVKLGLPPNPRSREEVQKILQQALRNNEVRVSQYTNGFRYYDIIITLFSKDPISQRDIADILEKAPRILVDVNEFGMHNTLKTRLDFVRNGMPMPPIIACLTREGKSTMQEIRLSTDPVGVVAAANIDAVRILSGISIEDAMLATDYSLGIRIEQNK